MSQGDRNAGSRSEARRAALAAWGEDILVCLAFFGRVPFPTAPNRADRPFQFARAGRAAPIAGFILGAAAALVLVLAASARFPALLAAAVAVLSLVVVSGALHEDGLADMADSLGGFTRERRLEILRDSRTGTFGVLALVFSVLIRTVALAHVLDLAGTVAAALALVATASLSRAAALWPVYALPPARAEGLGAGAAAIPLRTIRASLGLGAVMALALGAATSLTGAIAGVLAAAVSVLLLTRLAQGLLGGQTGDVAGAASQVAEMAFLAALTTTGPS